MTNILKLTVLHNIIQSKFFMGLSFCDTNNIYNSIYGIRRCTGFQYIFSDKLSLVVLNSIPH